MENTMKENIKTVSVALFNTVGTLVCVSTVKKIHDQAMPQIKEAAGGKKVWFIIITMLAEITYLGFAIGSVIGTVLAIKERVADHKIQRELETYPLDFMETGSEEDENSSEDSKEIKRNMKRWSVIKNDDDQIVMPR